MARTLSASDLIYRRPQEMSDTYELHAGNVRVAVVDPTFDCTGDRIVTLYRDGERVEEFRVTGWTVPIPQLVVEHLEELDRLHALTALAAKLDRWEGRQASADAHTSAAHAVIIAARPSSSHEGHELHDATTDRARALGKLVTVGCSVCSTSYSADGIARAAELHDESVQERESSRDRRAAQDARNNAILAERYGKATFPSEIVQDATGEVLRFGFRHGDLLHATYVPHTGTTGAVSLSLLTALELDASLWTIEAARGRVELDAPEEIPAPPVDEDSEELDYRLPAWELELLGESPAIVDEEREGILRDVLHADGLRACTGSVSVTVHAEDFPRPQTASVFGRPVPVRSVTVHNDGRVELWLAGGICLAVSSLEELRAALQDA